MFEYFYFQIYANIRCFAISIKMLLIFYLFFIVLCANVFNFYFFGSCIRFWYYKLKKNWLDLCWENMENKNELKTKQYCFLVWTSLNGFLFCYYIRWFSRFLDHCHNDRLRWRGTSNVDRQDRRIVFQCIRDFIFRFTSSKYTNYERVYRVKVCMRSFG